MRRCGLTALGIRLIVLVLVLRPICQQSVAEGYAFEVRAFLIRRVQGLRLARRNRRHTDQGKTDNEIFVSINVRPL